MYIGAKPTLVGKYDGYATGVFGLNNIINLINSEEWNGYLGSSISGTFYNHCFGYDFSTSGSNASFNVNGETYDVTGKRFNGDTTFSTVNLATTHSATVDRTYVAQINGNLTIDGTVTVGTQVRGCVFAVKGDVSLESGSIIATDYGADSYQPTQDWNLVRSDLNATHSVSATAINGVSQIFVGNKGASGFAGNAGSNGRCGSGGAGGVWNGNQSTAYGSTSSKGGIFAAGSGGGGSVDGLTLAAPVDFGGDGGQQIGYTAGTYPFGGGAGNPAGLKAPNGFADDGDFGVGGNITIIATGNVTIDASSSITSNGSDGGDDNTTSSAQFSGAGGASGGGSLIIFAGGSITNNGTITLNGGTGGSSVHSQTTTPGTQRGGWGGNGGAGSYLFVNSIQFAGV